MVPPPPLFVSSPIGPRAVWDGLGPESRPTDTKKASKWSPKPRNAAGIARTIASSSNDQIIGDSDAENKQLVAKKPDFSVRRGAWGFQINLSAQSMKMLSVPPLLSIFRLSTEVRRIDSLQLCELQLSPALAAGCSSSQQTPTPPPRSY